MINKNIKYYLLVLSLLLLSGCGVWRNFTTYFNTYYNAEKVYEKAMTEIAKTKRGLFDFKEKKITPVANKYFESVIKECSKILQFDSKSSYVGDALFMLGKAFYYQQNYSKAERKFRELASLNKSEVSLINELWIGKSQIHLREFDAGYNTLEDVEKKAIAKGNEKMAVQSMISQIRYFIYRENYTEAVNKIDTLLKVSTSSELNAEIMYELGKLYLTMEQPNDAAKAFADVSNYDPTFEIEFESKFEYAKLLGNLGKLNKSMDILQKMSDKDEFKDNWDKIELQIGILYYKKNDYNNAMYIFRSVDSKYKKTESAGIAALKMADIWKNNYLNYDSAMVYYNKSINSKAQEKYKREARSQSQSLKKYLTIYKKLNNYLTQLGYLKNPKTFIRDSLAYVDYKMKLKEEKKKGEDKKKKVKRAKFIGEVIQKNSPKITMPIWPKLSADSLRSIISDIDFEMGNLFFTELNVPDSSYYYYSSSLALNPKNLNIAKILYALGSYYLTVNDTVKADSLFNIVYKNYKHDRIASAAAVKLGKKPINFDLDPAEKIYLNAEKAFEDSDYSDAIDTLLKIFKKHPTSIYAAKSLYTIGFILENNLNKPDSAAAFYDSLAMHYRDTKYAKAIALKLNYYNDLKYKNKSKTKGLKQKKLKESLKPKKLINSKESRIKTIESRINKREEQLREKDLKFKKFEKKVNDTTNLRKKKKVEKTFKINNRK